MLRRNHTTIFLLATLFCGSALGAEDLAIKSQANFLSALPGDILCKDVFKFLDPNDTQKALLTNRELNHINNLDGGNSAEMSPYCHSAKCSPYGVKLQNGKWFYIQKVIQDNKLSEIESFKSFKDLEALFFSEKNRNIAKYLSQFMIQKIEVETSEIMSTDRVMHEKMAELMNYHQRLSPLLLGGLYNSYEPGSQNLAKSAYVQLGELGWTQVRHKIWESIGSEVRNYLYSKLEPQYKYSVYKPTDSLVFKKVCEDGENLVGVRMWASYSRVHWVKNVSTKIDFGAWLKSEQLTGRLFSSLSNQQVDESIRLRVRNHINNFDHLNCFDDFERDFDIESFKQTLEPLIKYAFLVYQLSTLVVHYSDSYEKLLARLVEGCSMLDLENIRIPDNTGNQLLDTQLMLQRKIKNAYLEASALEKEIAQTES